MLLLYSLIIVQKISRLCVFLKSILANKGIWMNVFASWHYGILKNRNKYTKVNRKNAYSILAKAKKIRHPFFLPSHINVLMACQLYMFFYVCNGSCKLYYNKYSVFFRCNLFIFLLSYHLYCRNRLEYELELSFSKYLTLDITITFTLP